MQSWVLAAFSEPALVVAKARNLALVLPHESFPAQSHYESRLLDLQSHPDASDSFLDFSFSAGNLASLMCRWGDAIRFYHRSLELSGVKANTLQNLSAAYLHTGRTRSAYGVIRKVARLRPHEPVTQSVLRRIEALLAVEKHLLPRQSSGISPLRLGILSDHHAFALHRHLRHADVAAPVGLPVLPSLAASRAWISTQLAEREQQRRIPFALIHQQFGMVGGAALIPEPDQCAAFHYWIGRDFQGQGFGRHALASLMQHASFLGFRRMESCVFASNIRSQRTLLGCGFQISSVNVARRLSVHKDLEPFSCS